MRTYLATLLSSVALLTPSEDGAVPIPRLLLKASIAKGTVAYGQ